MQRSGPGTVDDSFLHLSASGCTSDGSVRNDTWTNRQPHNQLDCFVFKGFRKDEVEIAQMVELPYW